MHSPSSCISCRIDRQLVDASNKANPWTYHAQAKVYRCPFGAQHQGDAPPVVVAPAMQPQTMPVDAAAGDDLLGIPDWLQRAKK